jgi:molybdopterin biosynthesis enzyme MoaB
MPNLNNQVSGSAIAFIDTQVENYQSLIAGVTPGTEVVVLDGNRDAIDQITEILARSYQYRQHSHSFSRCSRQLATRRR